MLNLKKNFETFLAEISPSGASEGVTFPRQVSTDYQTGGIGVKVIYLAC